MTNRTGWLGVGFSIVVTAALAATPVAAQAIKKGGTLTYMIPADAPPSLDGHKENTFATLHATAPFYSTLISINPDNPSSTTDIVCDLCTEMPKPTNDGKTYTFKIRKGVKFHDGTPLTAVDVAKSWQYIAFPPKGVSSARESYMSMVDKIENPDPETVVFRLKFATSAFLPALADPFAYIYKKDVLEKDPHWYEKNVLGSGPFKFVGYETGQSIKGARNPDYYHEGKPYLDGFTAIFAAKQSVRVDAIRADRAATEFRGMPPSARDELVKELGDKITVQTSDWNCVNLLTPNQKKKPFDDVRVRRALALAIDPWKGAPALSRIATVHTVGGLVFPGSPLAANKEELQKIAGFGPDIEKARAEARKLLKEAGAEGLKFELMNRNVDQPYKFVATWAIDEWSKIGLKVTQRVLPTGAVLRSAAQRQFRGHRRVQLPEHGQPAARCRQGPAALGLSRELWRLRGSEADRAVQRDAQGNRSGEAARQDARLRDLCARHQGRHHHDPVVESHSRPSFIHEGLEDQPEPLSEPQSREHLARQVERPVSRNRAHRCIATS
jgi:peptide/nickel transport system substrate-binding protein